MRDIWEIVQNNNWSELPVFKARETKDEHLQMAREEVSKWSPAERRMFGSDPLEPEKKPMTPQEALLLPAGKELDKFEAVHVMGWKPYIEPDEFSTVHAYAFLVEQKLFERGWWLVLKREGQSWSAGFDKQLDGGEWVASDEVLCSTIPLSICRAAIQVLIYEMEHTND